MTPIDPSRPEPHPPPASPAEPRPPGGVASAAAPVMAGPPSGVRGPAAPADSGGLLLLPEDEIGAVPPFPHPLRHPLQAMAWMIRTLFGLASLTLLLGVIAAIPVVNFLALGYLLDVEGRIARTGKLRFVFPLLEIAPRFGAIVVGLAGWLVPLWFLTSTLADYELISPRSAVTVGMRGVHGVAVVVVSVHLLLALARGGSLGCFVRPLKNVTWLVGRLRRGDYLDTAEMRVREFFAAMKLPHHFWLGVRGYFGAAIWLVIPSGLFAVYSQSQRVDQLFVSLLGSVLLMAALAWVPFLQARLATENRFAAIFELGAIRDLFCRSPFWWFLTVLVILLLSFPLYLFKIALPPSDAMWMETLVFVMTIYPARILTGWAYHRASTRPTRSHWAWHWTWRLLMAPLLGTYVFLLFFTPLFSEHGKLVLYEHHAFLLPVPF